MRSHCCTVFFERPLQLLCCAEFGELKQLLATQNPTTVHNLKDLTTVFWPEEDSIEDFLTFLRKQRQEAI